MNTKSVSIADRVFEQLESDILSEKYPAGTLLTETKISTDLGVSRTPVREAIRRLQQEHLVTESGKGSLVLGTSLEDLHDIYEIRLRIEGMAAAKAAKNISCETLKLLKETLDLQKFYTEKSNADKIKIADSAFHSIIYNDCGSSILCDILNLLHRRIQIFRKKSVEDSTRALLAVIEHEKIYEAIAAGDCSLAEELTITHINNALQHILRKK